ncbi:MAG: TonB-dependent receptor, partial [Bdellovibrionales bacterium]|nr:TonB-dependent receptor [Bdellovibrionales bacterium]
MGRVATADDSSVIESFSVIGQKESLPTKPGSAHILSEEELKNFDYDDITRILRGVPGVNIQEEDGFGLRPNIGFRGVHPHRSKKITLMEDGVLVAPAPYAAPAAYYFPPMDKISSIEVFKGVPSTRFGPNSIGGALNMLSKVSDPGLHTELAAGSFGYNKYNLGLGIHKYGDLTLLFGRTTHDGFKTLPNNKPTGFERDFAHIRWDKYFGYLNQNLTLKFGWADEKSHETYLGLSESDFQKNPYKRYSSSQQDLMKWQQRQYMISHAMTPVDDLRIRTTIYHQDFDRSWNKFNGFYDDTVDPALVLRNPNAASFNQFYRVMNGQSDSIDPADRDKLRITDNGRSFFSQGAQLKLDYELNRATWQHLFSLTYRFHRDQIDRNHVSQFFAMQSEELVATSLPYKVEKENTSDAEAHTATLGYEATWNDLFIQSALRMEEIRYREKDKLTSITTKGSDSIFAPGLGFFYQAFQNGGLLLGAHKGFTPVGPGQNSDVQPEEAINYEFGFRHTGSFGFELIGFYSDYKNILGTCTQSSGCPIATLDQRVNGGQAEILGAELLFSKDLVWNQFHFPLRFNATYTQAHFQSQFATTLSEWVGGAINSADKIVQAGDPVPYIPDLQSNLTLGVTRKKWKSFITYNYLGKMSDQAVSAGRKIIPSRSIIDFSLHYQWKANFELFFRADNLTDEKYIVSLRPTGLRPGKPQTF